MISRVRCPERHSSFRIASYWRMTHCVKDVPVFARETRASSLNLRAGLRSGKILYAWDTTTIATQTLGLQLYVLCCANKKEIASLEMLWIRYCSSLHLHLRGRLYKHFPRK